MCVCANAHIWLLKSQIRLCGPPAYNRNMHRHTHTFYLCIHVMCVYVLYILTLNLNIFFHCFYYFDYVRGICSIVYFCYVFFRFAIWRPYTLFLFFSHWNQQHDAVQWFSCFFLFHFILNYLLHTLSISFALICYALLYRVRILELMKDKKNVMKS